MQLKEVFAPHVSVKRIEERKDDEKTPTGNLLLIFTHCIENIVKERLFSV
jgi:hypothetical protein